MLGRSNVLNNVTAMKLGLSALDEFSTEKNLLSFAAVSAINFQWLLTEDEYFVIIIRLITPLNSLSWHLDEQRICNNYYSFMAFKNHFRHGQGTPDV